MNSKIKISSAMLVAGIYFSLLFEGYVAALLILGFVLLTESAAPLRRASITAIVIAFSFSILLFLINILPDTISLITNDIIGTFVAKTLNLSSFSKIFAMLYNITAYAKESCSCIQLNIFLKSTPTYGYRKIMTKRKAS